MTERRRQLTIDLHQQDLHQLDNFDAGGNGELVEAIRGLAAGARTPGLLVWGPGGCGRSHLLQAACHAAEAGGRRSLYLPLALLPRDPEVLENLGAGLVALDDVDAWLGTRSLEAALMGLYQRQFDSQRAVLVSAGAPAQRLAFALPDLASRLRALPGFSVRPPDDSGLRRILVAAAHRQGLILADPVLDFWLSRAPRSLPGLLAQLRALERRSLAEQRRITIPLVKEVLAL